MIPVKDTLINADDIVLYAANTNQYLSLLPNKAPQEMLNKTLSHLVEMVRPEYDEAMVESVMTHESVLHSLSQLRGNLSDCEFELEVFWANKIIAGQCLYTDYLYIDSYRALVESEVSVLKSFLPFSGKNFCFIGSGPLPITAFELKKMYPDIAITGIEMDKAAIALSSEVIRISDIDMNYIEAKAQELNYSDFDVVCVASMTTEKKNVLHQIAKTAKPGTIIAVRSVEQLRYMLYEPVGQEMIPPEFTFLGKTKYKPEHVNTTLFYRLGE